MVAPLSIETGFLRNPPPGHPRIIAVFAFQHDAHLVPGLLANLGPAIHGWAAWDDRQGPPTTEPRRRAALVAAAQGMGAEWIVTLDPDERIEDRFAGLVGEMVAGGPARWIFPIREMFTPKAWRRDGIWGGKRRASLFPMIPGFAPSPHDLHGSWMSGEASVPARACDINIYHLRMATPERRQLRRDLYASQDPERRWQAIGYDYLTDMRGMELEPIAPDRAFSPPFAEDHGLWAAPLPPGPPPPPDPPGARLARIERLVTQGQPLSASHVAEDMMEGDPDLRLLAADLALRAGDRARVADLLRDLPGEAMAAMIRWRAARDRGDGEGAAQAAGALARALPGSRIAGRIAAQMQGARAAAGRGDAPWRRWLRGTARLHEGAAVARADMAVVVIGLGARPQLAEAVASVLDQDAPSEIVVVNTGGGDARGLLAPVLDRIRLIEAEERHYVGAARNMGIDASDAPYVAFLAEDCRALPGWISARLARHRDGAAAVASAVLPEDDRAPASLAAHLLQHRTRRPEAEGAPHSLHGLSYVRRIFDDRGYFAPGLRTGEDTELNRRLLSRERVDWAPEVVTTHRYPVTTRDFHEDCAGRAPRKLWGPPISAWVDESEPEARLEAYIRNRTEATLAALATLPGVGWLSRWRIARLIRRGAAIDGEALGAAIRRVLKAREDQGGAETPEALRTLAGSAPQDWQLRLKLGRALRDAGDLAGAEAALRAAAAIAPFAHQPVEDLVALLTAAGRGHEALTLAEEAVIAAPGRVLLWICAHRAAAAADQPALALFLAQGGLMVEPGNGTLHLLLRRCHEGLGAAAAARRRNDIATDLLRRREAAKALPAKAAAGG